MPFSKLPREVSADLKWLAWNDIWAAVNARLATAGGQGMRGPARVAYPEATLRLPWWGTVHLDGTRSFCVCSFLQRGVSPDS